MVGCEARQQRPLDDGAVASRRGVVQSRRRGFHRSWEARLWSSPSGDCSRSGQPVRASRVLSRAGRGWRFLRSLDGQRRDLSRGRTDRIRKKSFENERCIRRRSRRGRVRRPEQRGSAGRCRIVEKHGPSVRETVAREHRVRTSTTAGRASGRRFNQGLVERVFGESRRQCYSPDVPRRAMEVTSAPVHSVAL